MPLRNCFAIPLAASLLYACSALADGGDIYWSFQGIEDIDCVAQLPDQDGDGRPEIVIESYDAGAVGDHLYCLSGGVPGSPTVLWSLRPNSGASDGGGWGDECLSAVPDLNGDGHRDIVLGTAWGNRSVHAVDAYAGALLWTFDTYLETDSGWVYSVDAFPDRTGDGIPEIACAVGSYNDSGYLLDGADGSKIFKFSGSTDALFVVRACPDADGDGVADLLFAAGDNDDYVYCVSGASSGSGTLIWASNAGGSNHGLCLLDDIDGDDVPDLAVGSWTAGDQVKALSGATGAPLWSFDNGSYEYIMRLVTISDADGDAFPDIAIGSWSNALRVISGRSGDLIWESYAGSANGGDFWAVDRVDDITGDGIDEVVGASFDTKVYLFDGADGDTLWIRGTGHRHYTVRGVGDLTGGGTADVVAGQQYLNGGGFAYAIEGGAATGVESWPRVEAVARFDPGRGVSLRWSCEEALPFQVYRLDESEGRRAGRVLMARALERKEISGREALDLIRRQESPAWTRLTDIPVEAAGEASGYAFLDDAGGPGSLYRLEASRAGEARVLAEVQAEPAGTDPSPGRIRAELYPNPFNPKTTLRFELEESATLGLAVHDAAGRRVATETPRSFEPGSHQWTWSAPASLTSGVYFITLEGSGLSRTLRAVLVK